MGQSTSDERADGEPVAGQREVPERPDDLSEASDPPPAPPDGYRSPEPFEYPTLVLLVGAVLLGFPTIVGFGALFAAAQGPGTFEYLFDVTDTAEGFSFTLSLWRTVVPGLLTLVCVVVAHEAVHGLVYRIRGYEVSYGVAPHVGAFYAAAFDQFQRRNAPLVVLDAVAIPLLFVPLPTLAFAAYVTLVVNTTAAVGDLYLLSRLRRMPVETLLYDRDVRHMYVYYPV
jgi:hypothetical protein